MKAVDPNCSTLVPAFAQPDRIAERPVLVLGAGPAGIAAGLALGPAGVVLDAAATPGGLCRTIKFEGAVFDWGGHSFHTPHPEIRDLVFKSLAMYEQPRQAFCFVGGGLIPYPFQAHFQQVADPTLVRECHQGLRVADGASGAGDFEEWTLRKFGPGIARHFLLPYNRKLWGCDLQRLAVDWTSERVAGARHTRENFATTGGRRTPLQADNTVAYPAYGGFGEITVALARRLPCLRLGRKVMSIDPLRREMLTSRGEILRWRQIVSTLPLDELIKLLPDVPTRIVDAASCLEALRLVLVLVVVTRQVEHPIQRVYCAGDEIPAHKIVVNHNSSPSLRSLPRHGILAEISAPPGFDVSDCDLQARVVEGLCKIGLLRTPGDVCAIQTLRVARAYPVPTHTRSDAVRELRAWLEERQIYLAGRFGEWAYINADEALYRGLKLGQRLLGKSYSPAS